MKVVDEREKRGSRTDSREKLICSHGIEEKPAKEKIEKLRWEENEE